MAYRVHGAAAQIRWGHYLAATLGAWTVEDQALSATATHIDTFRIAQQPLALVVGGQRFPLEGLALIDDQITARVTGR
jgi:hypothetical protein